MSTTGGGRRRAAAEAASFVLAWALMLHQAWLAQHGHAPSELVILFCTGIIAPTALQYVLAFRGQPPESPRSQASSSSSDSSDGRS